MASPTLFPKIGDIVDQTDGSTTTEIDNDEKSIQGIESLCMKCEEQARIHDLLLHKFLNIYC